MPRTCALLTLRLPRSLHPPSSDTDPYKGSPVLPYGTCVCTEAPAPWDPSIPVPHTLSLLTSPSISLTPFISPQTDTYPCKGSPVLPCGTGVCTKARAPWDPSILVPSCKCPFKLPSFEPTHLAGLPSGFPGEMWSAIGKRWSAISAIMLALWMMYSPSPFFPFLLPSHSSSFPLPLYPLPPVPRPLFPHLPSPFPLSPVPLPPALLLLVPTFPFPPCLLSRFLHISPARQQPMCPGGVHQCCDFVLLTPPLSPLFSNHSLSPPPMSPHQRPSNVASSPPTMLRAFSLPFPPNPTSPVPSPDCFTFRQLANIPCAPGLYSNPCALEVWYRCYADMLLTHSSLPTLLPAFSFHSPHTPTPPPPPHVPSRETFTCRHLASNPCAPGVCIDEMDGTYSCLCPLPFISFYFFSKDTARDVSKR
ncbi:unnamed protein product [Closterium sp. NIES-53]